MRRGLFIALATFCSLPAFSQSELTLPLMENVYQSTYANPVALPQHKVSIGLPASSVFLGTTNTGFSYNDMVGRRANDSTYLDFSRMISKMSKKNFLYAGASADLFSLRVRAKGIFFGVNVTEKFSVRFSYPKDLFGLLWDGTAQYAGGEAQLRSLGVDAIHYREYGFNVAKETKNWVFGGRVKYLTGFSNVNLRTRGLGLSVGQDMYDLAFTADAVLNTSGIPQDSTQDISDPSYMRGYLVNFKNSGMGLDGGVTYKYNDKLNFTFCFNDIGFIRWSDNVKNYNVKQGAQFSGIDFGKAYFGDSLDNSNNYADSLEKSVEYSETKKKYTTWLAPHIYLMARYNLTGNTQLTSSLFFEKYKAIRPALTLAVTQKVGRVLNVVVSYSVQYRKFNNVGLGLMVKPGPFQFYLVSDNMLALAKPLDAKSFNARFGMNLVFGRIKGEDKQPFNIKKRDQ